jgi:hypothetical protein
MANFDAKIFNPEVFARYIEIIPRLRLNELIRSGVLTPNAAIRALFSGAGVGTFYGTIPFFGRIDGTPLNYDGQTDITATGTTTYARGVVCAGRAKAWSEKDFSYDITGGVDFMGNAARQVSKYWQDVDQDTLLAILRGIFSMTGAENLKFVNAHTLDISGAGGDAAKMGPTTLNTAVQKACGDAKNRFSFVIMHSAVATNLENLNCLEYLKQTDANGIQRSLTLATWNGRMVLVDDGMPVEEVAEIPESAPDAGDGVPGYTKYTSYVLGTGAVDYENVGAKVPYEMQRDPKTNGGLDVLYTRQRKVFAPYGISFTQSSVASLSPTDAEYENGANWGLVVDSTATKVIEHKAIPIARIISRG